MTHLSHVTNDDSNQRLEVIEAQHQHQVLLVEGVSTHDLNEVVVVNQVEQEERVPSQYDCMRTQDESDNNNGQNNQVAASKGSCKCTSTPSVSSSSYQDEETKQVKECRICLSTEEGPSQVMVQPCMCKGSLKWAHVSCLQSWVHERRQLMCEICKSIYKEEYLPTLEHELHPTHRTQPSRQSSATEQARRRRALKTFIIVTIVVVTLTTTLVILGLNANNHTWAAICLRVIAFGLPMLIILRCILLWYQGRTIYST